MAAMTTEQYFTTDNNTNSTEEPFVFNDQLALAYNIVLMITTAFIMFSMGAGVSLQTVIKELKRPIGPIIGMVMQLFVVPALTFGFAHAFDFEGPVAVGMIVMASSPGGAVSNIMTYWSRGDLSLSVTMTLCSTLLCIGFVPLNMFIYTRSWGEETTIPYVNMVVTVLVVVCCAALGLLVQWRAPNGSKWLTRVGSFCGLLLILITGVIQSQLFPDVFDLPWTIWFVAVSMPLISWAMGYGLAAIFRFGFPQCRAIAYETGMQNAGVAFTIIAVSFPAEESGPYVQYPLMYATWMIVWGIGLCIVHAIHFCRVEKRTACQKGTQGIGHIEEEDDEERKDGVVILRIPARKPKNRHLSVGTFSFSKEGGVVYASTSSGSSSSSSSNSSRSRSSRQSSIRSEKSTQKHVNVVSKNGFVVSGGDDAGTLAVISIGKSDSQVALKGADLFTFQSEHM